MKRFRKYLDTTLNVEHVKKDERLAAYGVTCTYLSDPLEDFDEVEFRTDFGGENNLVITVNVEQGRVKRVMFSLADENNQDLVGSLSEAQLADFLAQKGDTITGFLDYITG